MQAILCQSLEGGFFHCDPHPANVFCMPDGRLCMIDFGMVRRLSETTRSGLIKELFGDFFNDPAMYADGIIERGIVGESDRKILEDFARKTLADPTMRSAIFDHDIKQDGDMKALFSRLWDLLKSLETFQTPQNELMFVRALGIAIDVCREVVPEAPVSELVTPVMIPILARFVRQHPAYARMLTQYLSTLTANKNLETKVRELFKLGITLARLLPMNQDRLLPMHPMRYLSKKAKDMLEKWE